MRIQKRLMILLISLFLTFSIVSGTFFYMYNGKILKHQIYNELEAVSNLQAQQITTFLHEQENQLSVISTEPVILDFVKANPEDKNYNELYIKADKRIKGLHKGIGLFNTKGILLAAETNPVGTDYSNTPYFSSPMNQTVFMSYYDKQKNKTMLGIITQIRDENDHLLASIGFDISSDVISDILKEKIGLGETGESILARRDENGDAVFFTQRKFESANSAKDIVSKYQINIPITQALLKKEILIENQPDYRGVQVLAATQYIGEADWGLVTKIDIDEALRPLVTIKNMALILSILFVFIGIIMSILISRSISFPIKKLTDNVDKISKGDFSVELKQSKIDEIYNLEKSLSRVLASMKLAILRTGVTKEELGLTTEEAIKAKKLAEDKAEERLKDLERFAKLAEGRELKMIEIKKKVKELEKKVKR